MGVITLGEYPNWATKFYADALIMDQSNLSGTPYVIAKRNALV